MRKKRRKRKKVAREWLFTLITLFALELLDDELSSAGEKIQAELSIGDTVDAKPGAVGDLTDGRIVAVLICSHVLEAEIWLSLEKNFKPDPDDQRAVFHADEIPLLRDKSVETLRKIHESRLVFPGSRIREQ